MLCEQRSIIMQDLTSDQQSVVKGMQTFAVLPTKATTF